MPEPIRHMREEIDTQPIEVNQVAMAETGHIVLRCRFLCGCNRSHNFSIEKQTAVSMADLVRRIVAHDQAQRN